MKHPRTRALEYFDRYFDPFASRALEYALARRSHRRQISYAVYFLEVVNRIESGRFVEIYKDLDDPAAALAVDDSEVYELTPIFDRIGASQKESADAMALVKELEELEPADIASFKSAIACNKCKSDDITYLFQQTRSADEPMTIFCTCKRCNSRWKM